MPLLRRLADVHRADSLSSRLRQRRFALVLRLLRDLPRPVRVLDVGGTETFWRNLSGMEPGSLSVSVLNISATEPSTTAGVVALQGDACAMPQFADQSFDVVFSNSVIEHVGELADQRRMADEVRRVGRRYFVQTPCRTFPIEPHFLFPYFQFLPVEAQLFLLRRTRLGWFERTPDLQAALQVLRSVRLLTEAELRAIFPGAIFLHERFLGLTKSLVACGGWDERALPAERSVGSLWRAHP